MNGCVLEVKAVMHCRKDWARSNGEACHGHSTKDRMSIAKRPQNNPEQTARRKLEKKARQSLESTRGKTALDR